MNAVTPTPAELPLLAHAEPAGGAALNQIVIATAGAIVALATLAWLCRGHRSGRLAHLSRAAELAERISGLPGWAALPSALAAVSLLVALLGMYWDISLHIDVGRDPGPLANPAHYLILAGLFGIFTAGVLAIALPRERPGDSAVRIRDGWYAPVGGILITLCGAFSLAGFPLDDLWHRLFGQDVTLWGPTHLMLIGGAAMSLVGQAVLLIEGDRARRHLAVAAPRWRREAGSLAVGLRRVGLMGGLLIGLSTFQGEFDFGVPQFRLVLEPVLLAIAASTALVCARLWVGRGGALAASAFFIAVRGGISLIVGDVLGQTAPHFPLYLAEATCVEMAGIALARRPLALGAVSGVAIGTVGFGAEWGWSEIAMPIRWSSDLFPEAMILAIAAGIAGGLLGGVLGSALAGRPPRGRTAPAVAAIGLAAIGAVFVDGLWTTVPSTVKAQVTLHELRPAPHREVAATVRIDPPRAAVDPAWLNVTAWQGGGLAVDELSPRGQGVYRTDEPIPVHGDWKATVRLQRGHEVLGLPIYMPSDAAIPAPKVPAKAEFTRPFVADHQLLQREQKPGVPGWLRTAAPLAVLALSLGFLTLLAGGVARLGLASPGARRRRVGPAAARSLRRAREAAEPPAAA
ncbi:MAG TPA: hypothetical protein VE662_07410 [Solirubrobacterales bacterium]|nr:hypothetical protein [Solirubrobacterales bacterium]